jgi:large subunit ribosomal protein L19e
MTGFQKKIAAKILKVGESKVWLDPTKAKDINAAITKADIRKMIQKGAIKILKQKTVKPKRREKRRRKAGSKKGAKYSIVTRKRKWINTVRPLRNMLKELRDSKQIDSKTYKNIYLLIKGGMFRSRSHLKIYMEQHGLLKKR